jgi:hypothetical protein
MGLGLLSLLLDHFYCLLSFLPLQEVKGIQTGPASRIALEALQDTHVPFKLSGRRIPAWKQFYPNRSGQPSLAPNSSRLDDFTGRSDKREALPSLDSAETRAAAVF